MNEASAQNTCAGSRRLVLKGYNRHVLSFPPMAPEPSGQRDRETQMEGRSHDVSGQTHSKRVPQREQSQLTHPASWSMEVAERYHLLKQRTLLSSEHSPVHTGNLTKHCSTSSLDSGPGSGCQKSSGKGEFSVFPLHSSLLTPWAFRPSLWSRTAAEFLVKTESHRGQGGPACTPCVPSRTLRTWSQFRGHPQESLTLAKIGL